LGRGQARHPHNHSAQGVQGGRLDGKINVPFVRLSSSATRIVAISLRLQIVLLN
jgi:hypothetical protein